MHEIDGVPQLQPGGRLGQDSARLVDHDQFHRAGHLGPSGVNIPPLPPTRASLRADSVTVDLVGVWPKRKSLALCEQAQVSLW